jgi:hypothetical protein
VYVISPAPDTIDAMVAAVEARGIAMPASDLLLNRPCEALGDHLQTGAYAGRHYLDGDWYHHLLLTSDAVDVQFWVAVGETPEIHKLVITYTTKPGEPRYRALLRDWSFDPTIDGSTFTFVPPVDARKVAFRDAGTMMRSSRSRRSRPGGNRTREPVREIACGWNLQDCVG